MMTLTFDEYLLYNRKLYVIFIKVRLSMKNLRQEWLGNTKGDILAGIVVFKNNSRNSAFNQSNITQKLIQRRNKSINT